MWESKRRVPEGLAVVIGSDWDMITGMGNFNETTEPKKDKSLSGDMHLKVFGLYLK